MTQCPMYAKNVRPGPYIHPVILLYSQGCERECSIVLSDVLKELATLRGRAEVQLSQCMGGTFEGIQLHLAMVTASPKLGRCH